MNENCEFFAYYSLEGKTSEGNKTYPCKHLFSRVKFLTFAWFQPWNLTKPRGVKDNNFVDISHEASG